MKDKRIISIAYNKEQFPKHQVSEVVIAGRSNCGKSSFINTLLGGGKLAKTSSKPGKTVSINFFKYSENITLVDLPGYGYAKISKETRESWRYFIENYLMNREQLKKVLLLLDVRRSIEDQEVSFINWLYELNIPCKLIFTKIDKLSNNEFINRKRQLLAQIEKLWQDSNSDNVFFISSLKKIGITPLKKEIEVDLKT